MKLQLDPQTLQDKTFWLKLCNGFSISEDQPLGGSLAKRSSSSNKLRDDDWEVCKITMHQDGYFAYDSWFDPELIERMAAVIEKLTSNDIPPIFCFVFDEFWEVLTQVDPMMKDLVGEYWLLPAVWAWHVTADNQSGFAPHRDQVRDVGVDDDEHLDYLTCWIPLTDLNHLSSCISLLPASKDADYDSGTQETRVENLQDIRTLQGKKGSVFCWTTGVIHWGTSQSRLGRPRISIGFYVQNPEAECYDPPPMDLEKPLSLRSRLSLIGQQIIHYSRTADHELLKLANQLAELES
jgi:hypothetical protein